MPVNSFCRISLKHGKYTLIVDPGLKILLIQKAIKIAVPSPIRRITRLCGIYISSYKYYVYLKCINFHGSLGTRIIDYCSNDGIPNIWTIAFLM